MKIINCWDQPAKQADKIQIKLRLGKVTVFDYYSDESRDRKGLTILNFKIKTGPSLIRKKLEKLMGTEKNEKTKRHWPSTIIGGGIVVTGLVFVALDIVTMTELTAFVAASLPFFLYRKKVKL